MKKNSFINDRKKIVIWCIFVFAIVINVYLYVHLLNNFPHLLDGFESPYIRIAENLYKHGEYSFCESEDCVPDTYVLPVAPLIGYLVFLICGVGNTALEVIRIILMLSNFGIIIIAYYIGKIFNYKVGCVAAFLAAADVSMFCWSNNFKPDMIYAFLFTMSIYFLVKFIKIKQSKKSIILASLFLGLAVLTKAGLYMLFPLIAGFLLVFLLFVKKGSFIKCFYYVSLFVVIQLVFITGWQVRNYHATGVYAFASGKTGELTLFKDHIPCLIAYQEGISKKEARKRLRKKYETEDIMKLDIFARNKYYMNVATRIVLNSPLDYAVTLLKNLKIGAGTLFLGTTPPDFLFSKKKREDLFEIMQVKLYTEYYQYGNDDTTSLPMLSKQEPIYMGPFSSFPLMKKLWNSNHYSYIFLWSMIKAHILLIYIMAIIGILLILKDKSGRWVLILMVLITAYYIALLGPVTVSRHRTILMPIFCFLSSYGLIWLGNVFQQFINSRANLIKPESLNKDNVL
jgi:hypothetical protein